MGEGRPTSTAARLGRPGTRLPSLGGGQKKLSGPLYPGRPPPTMWGLLECSEAGFLRGFVPKSLGHPPLEELGSTKPPLLALSGRAVCSGLEHLSLPLSTWAPVNLRLGGQPAAVSLQPGVLSTLGTKHKAHKPPGPFLKALNAPSIPGKPWYCPAPRLTPPPWLRASTPTPQSTSLAAGPGARPASAQPHGSPWLPPQGLRLIWPFILNG